MRGHSFDQHRYGYLNLLQPQDSRSRRPGDSKDTARARRRLAEKGLAETIHRALAHAIQGHLPAGEAAILDVGCGEGAFLRSIAEAARLESHGIDISPPSIELAAKASRDTLFVVANADRFLPYAVRSFDFITSIDARVNATEFARVVKPGGLVLVAVPSPDDLIELRESIQGEAVEKPRGDRVVDELNSSFALIERATVRETRTIQPDGLRDVLTASYRGFRLSESNAVASLPPMTVTLSHDILAFRPR